MNFPKLAAYPRQWIINGDIWEIKFVRQIDKHKECLGLCDPSTNTIYILLGQGREATLATMVHELLHAIGFSWEIEVLQKERLIGELEIPLSMFIVDNLRIT